MRLPFGKEHTFTRADLEYLVFGVDFQVSIQDVEEFIFPGVNMRRRFRSFPHFRHDTVEGTVSVSFSNSLVLSRILKGWNALIRFWSY